MKSVEITPEAYEDLEGLKEYLDEFFGVKKEKEILKAIFKDMKRLAKCPETDIKLFERFGIATDYKCMYTHKNYVFYRIENEYIKSIRILDERRDFLYVLFGVKMNSDESEKYWEE